MSITVADCLKLTSLREAKVVAGFEGLNNVVVSVSVLEYAVATALDKEYFINNEIVITAFISIKDDVEAQCATLRRLHEAGEVGLILYYVGVYLPRLDERLIETANELNFPLICMPEKRWNLRYSEVICDVMEAIYKDQMQKTYFVGEMLDRISQLPNHQRTIDTLFRMVSDRIRCMLILTDRSFNILNVAAWPMAATAYDQSIVDYYKSHPAIMASSSQIKIEIDQKMFYANYQSVAVERGSSLNLIIVNEETEISYDSCQQALEIVRLFINIWSQNEGYEGSAELVRAILSDEPAKMRRLAEILHINVSSIHIMWVLKNKDDLTCEEQEKENTRLMIKLKQFLQEHDRLAVVDIYEENVVAFMDNPTFEDEISYLADVFIKELSAAQGKVTLAMCTDLQNTTEVRESYILLQNHLKNAQIIFPRNEILTYHEILFAADCYEIILQGEEAVFKNLLPLRPLRSDEKDQENEWITTLSTFMLDTQTNVSQTSEILFMHKSTVKYRINKINEKLNYRVLKLPEAYKLYVALAIERLLTGLK